MHFNLKQTGNCEVGVSMVQGCCYTEGHPGASWAQLSSDTYLQLTIKLTPVAKCAEVEIFSPECEYPDSGPFLPFSF